MADTFAIFDDRPFLFECSIQTVDGRSVILSQSIILYLEIKESIFTGFPEGTLLLENIGNGIDGSIIFEGNSLANLLSISIQPGEDKGGSISPIGDEEEFKISEVFSIYNIIDEPIGEYPQMAKKIFFRHVAANELRQRKNFLTVENFLEKSEGGEGEGGGGETGSSISVENMSNNERSIKTGDMLKKLFEDKKESLGFTIGQDWDKGKYSMFPNWPPGTETLYDSIQKVYMKHVSEKEPFDKCFFKYDRHKKELSLMPINKMLKKNTEEPQKYFLETFVLGHLGDKDPESKTKQYNKAKISKIDITPDLSQIRTFRLKDLSAQILEKEFLIVLPPVIDFDNVTRYDLGEKNLKDIYDKFYKKYYVEQPFQGRVNGQPKPMVIWENSRKKLNTKYNKTLLSSYKSWNHAYDVEVNAGILSTLLFDGSLNSTVSVRGATHRTAGKFIDIAVLAEPTLQFAKVPGRWFITECSHIFTKDKYINSLNCIKTYRNF